MTPLSRPGDKLVNMTSRLPEMADGELSNILGNARRLIASGSAAQRTAAAAMLPSIEAEVASRETTKAAQKLEAAAARRAGKESSRAQSGRAGGGQQP